MASLDRIRIHPIKSLDAVTLQTATIQTEGGLAWDRRYAIVERNGEDEPLDDTPPISSSDLPLQASDTYVNGKREPAVHGLRAEYDLERETVSLSDADDPTADGDTFHLELDRDCLASWLSEYLGYPVELVRDEAGGFPDDTDASGPTVIAGATLDAVASWYDGIDAPELCRRLRPNLVVEGVPAFWEDGLYGPPGRGVSFTIGAATFQGINPCQRCVVPTRNPDTGEPTDGFRETFVERRRETLPDWASEEWFDHYFRLMVNTTVSESSWGTAIETGDAVSVGERQRVPQ